MAHLRLSGPFALQRFKFTFNCLMSVQIGEFRFERGGVLKVRFGGQFVRRSG